MENIETKEKTELIEAKDSTVDTSSIIELPKLEEVKVEETKAVKKVKEQKKEIPQEYDVVPQTWLVLKRTIFNDKETIGELSIDGKFYCWTLEDKDRGLEVGGKKIKKETAIPKGIYEVAITWSNKFQRRMPILLNVPQFEGIRIHVGNSNVDTEGCILLGFKKTNNRIQSSREATNMFYSLLAEKLKKEKVFITIK